MGLVVISEPSGENLTDDEKDLRTLSLFTIPEIFEPPEAKPEVQQSNLYYSQGLAYYRSGEYQKAIEAYKEAIRIRPELTTPHFDLGVAYLKAGDRESAMKEYEILKGSDAPNAPALADKLLNLIRKTQKAE